MLAGHAGANFYRRFDELVGRIVLPHLRGSLRGIFESFVILLGTRYADGGIDVGRDRLRFDLLCPHSRERHDDPQRQKRCH